MKKTSLFFCIFTVFIFTGYAQTLGVRGQLLNRAASDIHLDSVRNSINLPEGFSGKNVIIGVTDWGFDYTHPVFYDTNMTEYRVLRAWDQFKTSGPAPQGFNYGTEHVNKNALLTAKCDTFNVYEYGYHGTHVASIAGGAGAKTPYRGIAYNADLLFATFLVNEQSVIDAWRWMKNVADSEHKRLVINMSWGLFYMGNMDGTGKLADALEELSQAGVVFVASAGNNGSDNFHIEHDFNNGTDTIRTQIEWSESVNNNTWGQSISMMNSHDFSFALELLDGTYETVAITDFYGTQDRNRNIDTFLVISSNDTVFYNVEIRQTNDYNTTPQVRLILKKNTTVFNLKPVLTVTALSGTFHALNVMELTNGVGNWGGKFIKPTQKPEYLAGDSKYGLGMPAAIESAITVASHNSTSPNTFYYKIGDISFFSSYGPTFDHRAKPDISAPGFIVTAALSSHANPMPAPPYDSKVVEFKDSTYRFLQLYGTSMSAPIVAGVAALLLQVNPYLSAQQVKDFILETAYEDNFTKAAGVNRFGHGKLNAYAAVKKAVDFVGLHHYSVPESHYNCFPNPASNQLYISVQSDISDIRGELYDIYGRLVVSQYLQPGVNTISLEQLPPSYYILKLDDGKKTEVQKIIKL